MKKKGFIFLLSLISGLFLFSSIKAKEESEFVNLIDLNNIYLTGDQQKRNYRPSDRLLHMKDYVNVEVNEDYTVVIHQYFFEQDFDSDHFSLNESNLNLQYESGLLKSTALKPVFDYQNDVNGYAWATFKAEEAKVKISSLKTRVDNTGVNVPFKIIMYKGVIDDFKDFYSFKSNYKTKEGNLIINVDNPLTITEIASLVSSSNNIEVIINKDNYSQSKDKIGSYFIEFIAKDNYINAAFLKINVHVVDIVKPLISGKNLYEVNLEEIESFSLNDIKSSLLVSDNYSDLTNDDLVIVSDTFTPNKTKIGDYQVVYRAKDSSGNEADYLVSINIKDNQPPLLTGPMELFRYSTDPKLTTDQVKKMYTAYDEVDGDLSNNIIVDGIIDSIPGTYEISISVKDSSNNEAYKKLFIKVVEGIPPTFSISNLILTNEQYNSMTKEDIIGWLENNLVGNVSEIKIIYDEITISEEGKFIYFSYEKEGRLLYGRIEVVNKTNKKLLILTLSGGLVIISASIGFFVFKRRK